MPKLSATALFKVQLYYNASYITTICIIHTGTTIIGIWLWKLLWIPVQIALWLHIGINRGRFKLSGTQRWSVQTSGQSQTSQLEIEVKTHIM